MDRTLTDTNTSDYNELRSNGNERMTFTTGQQFPFIIFRVIFYNENMYD